jgi:hypothetical protein
MELVKRLAWWKSMGEIGGCRSRLIVRGRANTRCGELLVYDWHRAVCAAVSTLTGARQIQKELDLARIHVMTHSPGLGSGYLKLCWLCA